jgi:Zn-dependent peptidase ImmA (M78 family)
MGRRFGGRFHWKGESVNPKEVAQELLDYCWDRMLPVRLNRLAELLGARVVVRGGSFDASFECKGRVAWTGMRPLLEVNTHEGPLARRVVIAHLLGHFAMRHYDCAPDTALSFEADATDQDRAANEFAAAVLMPEDAVREARARGQQAGDLADTFQVPLSAMTARLRDLGLA